MTTNFKFKEAIAQVVATLEKEAAGSADLSNVIVEICDLISEEYLLLIEQPDFNLSQFKAIWIQRIVAAKNNLNLTTEKKVVPEKIWKKVLPLQQQSPAPPSISISSSSKSSPTTSESSKSKQSTTSSLSYQKKLSIKDLTILENNHRRIANKWNLKSGAYVEDIVYNEAKLLSYEHPLHSFIIDLHDGSLEDQIEQEEFEEIRSFSDDALNKSMPDNLKQILNRLNQKCSSNDIFDEFNSIAAHPAKDPEIFWLKQAVIDYALLFMDQNDSALKLPSTEQDLLEDIYGFIKKSKRLSSTTCTAYDQMHGNESQSSSMHKNSLRTIGGRYQEKRKTAGDHADLCFYYGSTELACLEIGLADGGPHGTKELNEAGIKTPIMMKNFSIQISQQYGIKMNEIRIVGMVISGFSLTALLMTFKGSTSLITRSKRISLPQNVADIPRLLPLALKLVYNASQIVKGTMDTIKKASASVILDENDDLPYFPPCHISTNKRKNPEEEN